MSSDTVSTRLLIGGVWREPVSEARILVHNPARRDEVVGSVSAAARQDVARAVAAADGAFAGWSALTPSERAGYLRSAAKAITRDVADVEARARLLTRENGKILRESSLELARLGDRFEYTASLAARLEQDERLAGPPFDSLVTRKPRGVAALILPWNWPLSILGAKLPQALLAGNTVVVLPSCHAPLATLLTLKLIADELPPGVVNGVTGTGEEAGAELVEHPLVRKVAFTGSAAVGKVVMSRAACTCKHVTLELGGNDPAIFLEDADITEETVRKLVMGSFMTAGQICMAAKRVYAHRSIYHRLVEAFTAAVGRSVVGDGLDPRSTMGPVNNKRQFDRVSALIAEARARGAQVVEVGEKLNAGAFELGHFLLPTVISQVDSRAKVVAEEQFGPVLPFLPFDSEDEAVAMANDSEYGLCSSVWSRDRERALRVARRLEAGYTYLNAHGPGSQDSRAPFGGVKQSGLGRELGYDGVLEFSVAQSITGPAGWLFGPA